MPAADGAALRAEVRRWLAIVEEDLAAARLCLGAEPVLSEIAAYHAQQALEKTAKAWLVRFGRPFRKTHSIDELAGQAAAVDVALCQELTHLAWVTAWGTAYRYPQEEPESPPGRNEVAAVLDATAALSARLRATLVEPGRRDGRGCCLLPAGLGSEVAHDRGCRSARDATASCGGTIWNRRLGWLRGRSVRAHSNNNAGTAAAKGSGPIGWGGRTWRSPTTNASARRWSC